jgi:hypothetical protein
MSTTWRPYQIKAPQNKMAATQLNTSIHRATPGGTTLSTRSGLTWLSVRTNWLDTIMIAQIRR